LAKLAAIDLVYPAFESRGDIAQMIAEWGEAWPRDPDGAPLYPGRRDAMTEAERQARMQAGEPYALRLDLAAAVARAGPLRWREEGVGPDGESGIVDAKPSVWGDLILARKDVPTSYHLSVVVDDALQGVTEVVRGQDLFWSTSVHRLLQTLLGLKQPHYRHHRLVLDADGRKLSKSTKATALRELRAKGATPTDIRREIGMPQR
jgi:glutamyl-Q tRNA(Asp) synthetase